MKWLAWSLDGGPWRRGLLVLVAALGLGGALRADQSMGLQFATEEQLRAVPPAVAQYSGTELPRQVDLSDKLPPPGHQGNQNSCVGWTVAYGLKTFHEHLEEGHPPADRQGRIDPRRVFSPAFIYNQINNGRDGGSSFIDALNLLSEQGAATLADMPYSDQDFRTRPQPAQVAAAKRYRISYWRKVNILDLREVKSQLNANFPIMIGAMVDDGFMQLRGRHATWNRAQGQARGGHAMLVVGYDDQRAAFRVFNSWGTEWGDGGYCWLDYTLWPRVVREGFVAKDAINGPGPVTDPTRPNPPPVTPMPPPVRVNQASLVLTNVEHNLPDMGNPNIRHMRFSGTVSVPAGTARALQVVVHFNYRDPRGGKGQKVGATIMQFSDVHGAAATGTPPLQLPPQGLKDFAWTCFIPYSALNVPLGQWQPNAFGLPVYAPRRSHLVAEPVLFLDNFGVATGGLLEFWMDR